MTNVPNNHRTCRSSGGVLVEMAIVLPVLLVFGLVFFEIGRFLQLQNVIDDNLRSISLRVKRSCLTEPTETLPTCMNIASIASLNSITPMLAGANICLKAFFVDDTGNISLLSESCLLSRINTESFLASITPAQWGTRLFSVEIFGNYRWIIVFNLLSSASQSPIYEAAVI